MSCKPVVRWWQEGSSPPEKPKPVAAEAPIDLTSDDEDGGQGCLRQGSVEGSLEAPGTACPENYKTKAKVSVKSPVDPYEASHVEYAYITYAFMLPPIRWRSPAVLQF